MTDHGQWEECPAGLVTTMAGELRSKRLRARLRPVIASVAILLVLGVTWAVQSPNRADAEPLNCAETVPLLADYHAGTLPRVATTRVAEHLANCDSCRKHFNNQFPGEAHLPQEGDRLQADQAPPILLGAR